MRVLIVASDKAELKAFPDTFEKVASGVGPVLAAASAAYAIAEHLPDVVFSVGSAGSAGKLSIGECVSFARVVSPDFDLSSYGLEVGSTLMGNRKILSSIELDRNSSYVLSSSGSFNTGISLPFHYDAADMEAYGVAFAASMRHIPCFAVKVITDVIGEHVDLGEYGYTLRSLRSLLPLKVEEILSSL